MNLTVSFDRLDTMTPEISKRYGYQSDIKITDVLLNKKFTLSTEVIPPRNGTEQLKVVGQIYELIQNGTEFLSVTKGAGGSLRGGSLPIAQMIKENFKKPCIAHFTCRDITPEEAENQLMDHHYFGIRNILALRGDPPLGEKNWTARENSYSYAYQLIQQIKNLNQGIFLSRTNDKNYAAQNTFLTKTDFCIGAAVYPEHPNLQERIDFFKLKIYSGAEYAITQMLFNPEAYSDFLELCYKNHLSIPILPGTRILKDQEQAHRMSKRFEVSLCPQLLKKLPEKSITPEDQKRALDVFFEYIEILKSKGAPGLHLFVISDTELACQALHAFQKAGG